MWTTTDTVILMAYWLLPALCACVACMAQLLRNKGG